MNELCDAIARIQLGPTEEEIDHLTDQLSKLRISARLQCPICGKLNVQRNNFWRHRKGKACLAARAKLIDQIVTGHHATRALLASEAIAKTRH